MAALSPLAFAAGASDVVDKSPPPPELDPSVKTKPDLSGRKRLGKASFYANRFAGRKMADGTAMNPHGNNAASRTLPLGTTARVTNLETGQSATVTIQDRGPYVAGRIVDLSPSTARKIGITPKEGVAKVAVVPISVPQPSGGVKPGEAAREQRIE
jgi:rare lipoprotein A